MKFTPKQMKKVVGKSMNMTIECDSLGKLNSKHGKKMVSFLEDQAHLGSLLKNRTIVAIFTTKKLSKKIPKKITTILTDNPKYDFGKFHNFLVSKTKFYSRKQKTKSEISKSAILNSSEISSDVSIGPQSRVEYSSVILSNVKIGKNVMIAPHVIIGEEGEFFVKNENKILRFIFDGGVLIENDVKIQSLVSIKRGLFGNDTIISSGCTIGSFSNIGHDVKLGKNCYLAPGSIISGGCIVGNDCFFGVNSCVKNGIKIGNNCIIGAGTVVTKHIKNDSVVVGVPGRIIRKNK